MGGDNGATDPNLVAEGVRISWEQVPETLRAKVEALLGSPVVAAVTQRGGFSPGAAARLRLADGRRAFVKAVGATLNPDTPDLYRAEIRVAGALPAGVPSPRLLGSFDEDGWVALVFEDVAGAMPGLPWDPDVLVRVVDVLARMAAVLDPAPLAAPSAEARYGDKFTGWRQLAEAGAQDPVSLAFLDPWTRGNLDRLVALEADGARAAGGTALQHMDIRADNLLVTADGEIVVVDWPWALVGAPWLDLLTLGISVWMHDAGGAAARVIAEHPLLVGADQEDVTAVLAGFTGMLMARSQDPAPPGLPTIRPWQAAIARGGVAWLRTRLDQG